MHLTNYSINKHNENFDRDDSDDSGSKRYNTTTLLYNKHKKKNYLMHFDFRCNRPYCICILVIGPATEANNAQSLFKIIFIPFY